MATFKEDASSAVVEADTTIDSSSDASATDSAADDTVMEHSIFEKWPEGKEAPLESKSPKTLLSHIDAERAPLYAELLHEKVGFLKRSQSSSSSSDPMQQPQKKILKVHISISSDETPMMDSDSGRRCDFVCLPCAHAGVPPILECCLKRGHSETHLCILCLGGTQQVETSSAFRLPFVADTQPRSSASSGGEGEICGGEGEI